MPLTRSRKRKAYPVKFFISVARAFLKFTVYSEKSWSNVMQAKGHRFQNQVFHTVISVFV